MVADLAVMTGNLAQVFVTDGDRRSTLSTVHDVRAPRVGSCSKPATRDSDSGAVDLQTLQMITDHHGRQSSVFGVGAHFGVYGEVVRPGVISVGDGLRLTAVVDCPRRV